MSNAGATSSRLTIFPPQPLSGLCVHKAIGVHDREDVEVVFVDIRLNFSRIGVIVQQAVRNIFRSHGSNPFPGMDSAVEDGCWFAALSTTPIDVNPCNWPSLVRGACGDNLAVVGKCSSDLVEPG